METKTVKWRLNLFDIIFIAAVLVIAFIIIAYLGISGGLFSRGTQETVIYTLELTELLGDSASRIRPGDELVDTIERRVMGTILSVEVKPTTRLQADLSTGNRVFREVPEGYYDATLIMSAEATVDEIEISLEGYVIRIGTWLPVSGPLYQGTGYITYIERNDMP